MRPFAETVPEPLLGADPAAVSASVRAQGVTHGAREDRHDYVVDPVPRVVDGAEWDVLTRGLIQRVRALEAFVADCHGEQRALREGVVPADLLEDCPWWEPGLVASPPGARTWIGCYGPDLIRRPDGVFAVLEDNCRTPTLQAAAIAARRALGPALEHAGVRPRPAIGPLVDALRAMLGPGRAVVLTDGADSAVGWEVGALAGELGLDLALPSELAPDGDHIVTPDGRAIDVLWRRTSMERMAEEDFDRRLGRALRAGNVRVVNAFGAGVADDKRTFPYVPDLIGFYGLGDPELPQLATCDLATAAGRAAAAARLGDLVLKPRTGSGGYGVEMTPDALPDDPSGWIAQERTLLSTHPTLVDGALVPRHVDLRPFVIHDGLDWTVPPTGLSRFALAEGDLVVNSSQGGGGKDVWVVDP